MRIIGIIGASGHGRLVADIAMKMGYDKVVFYDDNDDIDHCGLYRVIGGSEEAAQAHYDFFVAIGNPVVRGHLIEKLEREGKNLPVLIHPSAVIGENVSIGAGTVVVAGAVVNPGAVIGKGCIINTCASVDHDCVLEDYVHIAVGAHVAGTVQIRHHTWVGAGATVINNLNICPNCMIGAGAVVCKSIEEEGTYVGVPAKKK